MLGIEDVEAYCNKFEQTTVPKYFSEKRQNWAKKPWDKFVTSTNVKFIDDALFDLLTKMLVFDHTQRLTATEAIQHPFFDSVRNEYEHELI